MKGDHDVLKPHEGRPRCFGTMKSATGDQGAKSIGKTSVLAMLKQKYKKALVLLLFLSHAKSGHKKVIGALVLLVF